VRPQYELGVRAPSDPALAYGVELLIKRRLLAFDAAAGIVDGAVDGIIEFAQVLDGNFGRDEDTEPNAVVNHRDIDSRRWIELTAEVVGQRLYPIFRPGWQWPEVVDDDRLLAIEYADGRLVIEEWSSRRRSGLCVVHVTQL
jgi:hypothetical protein